MVVVAGLLCFGSWLWCFLFVGFGPALGGTRCIRANQPWKTPLLPTHRRGPLSRLFPQRRNKQEQPSLPTRFNRVQQQHKSSFLERLRRGRNQPQPERPLQFRPFVEPICIADNQFDLTPRLVQYYEVTFLEDRRFQRTLGNECIAVGLSCPEFSPHTHMPGWDCWSYGYHGDDGGVFHGKWQMLRAFGPTFGVGDTVGCGLDYHLRQIFFTLNGRYLGPAWTHLSDDMLERDWYPTVAVTASWAQANFGANLNTKNNAPFAFDLVAYVQECHTPAIQLKMIVRECETRDKGGTANVVLDRAQVLIPLVYRQNRSGEEKEMNE